MVRFEVPSEYSPEAKKYISELVKLLNKEGSVNKLDSAALSLIGSNYDTYTKAQQILGKEGLVIRDADGIAIRPHPMVKTSHDAEVKLIKLLIEFGMTPHRRHKAGKDKPKEEPSPMEKFFSGQREVR